MHSSKRSRCVLRLLLTLMYSCRILLLSSAWVCSVGIGVEWHSSDKGAAIPSLHRTTPRSATGYAAA